MKAKINRTNVTDHLIQYQLEMIGKTISDIKNDEKWYYNNTITQEQQNQLEAYAIPLLKKVFKFNKSKAEMTFSWFILQFGLRIKN